MQHLSDCTRDADESCCCPENLTYEVYEVVEHRYYKGDWVAEAINYEGEGEIYSALFSGYDAEARAREYAEFKNEQRPPWAKDKAEATPAGERTASEGPLHDDDGTDAS